MEEDVEVIEPTTETAELEALKAAMQQEPWMTENVALRAIEAIEKSVEAGANRDKHTVGLFGWVILAVSLMIGVIVVILAFKGDTDGATALMTNLLIAVLASLAAKNRD